MTSVSTAPAISAASTAATVRPVLPSRGVARVKSVLSGDTCILVGSSSSSARPPEVVFTLERITAPRLAGKANNQTDEPGAFSAREFLRTKIVGKSVTFLIKNQGTGDRVYGLLLFTDPDAGTEINLAVESVRNGYATPKLFEKSTDEASEDDGAAPADSSSYESQLKAAFEQAMEARVGIHSDVPLVRAIQNAGTDFETLSLIEKTQKLCKHSRVKCVLEYIFDGSRMRCHVTDDQMAPAGLQYGSFTLLVAGITAPRVGNPKATPPMESEPFSMEARQFVELRLLQRELDVTLHGTDKSGVCAVGTVHHPRGNIAIELLKNGLART